MSHLPPSLRARRSTVAIARPAPRPLAAPEIVAALREAVCEACPNNASGRCRLFGCCDKDISTTVKLALQQCPAGHWSRWLPTQPPS